MFPQPRATSFTQQPGSTVVTEQPGSTVVADGQWRTGLFDCFDDLHICCRGTYCTLCLMFKVSEAMEEPWWIQFCVPCTLMSLRTKWRRNHNIEGSKLEDCGINLFCCCCGLCQLARESKACTPDRTLANSLHSW